MRAGRTSTWDKCNESKNIAKCLLCLFIYFLFYFFCFAVRLCFLYVYCFLGYQILKLVVSCNLLGSTLFAQAVFSVQKFFYLLQYLGTYTNYLVNCKKQEKKEQRKASKEKRKEEKEKVHTSVAHGDLAISNAYFFSNCFELRIK
jgi:predicted membrane protein